MPINYSWFLLQLKPVDIEKTNLYICIIIVCSLLVNRKPTNFFLYFNLVVCSTPLILEANVECLMRDGSQCPGLHWTNHGECVCVCVCMCVCERERERGERERERESERERERERECVCVCVCVCERERVCVCVRERVCVCVCVCKKNAAFATVNVQ